ncbi:MAG: NAD(P)/FAD-dependent oxidoreductase [Tunicatimonas sp.]
MEDKYSLRIPDTQKKRVVVIGGGFGGMNVIKHLDNELFQVVLFDRNNFHTFIPLLYQVATAGIEPDSVVDPLRNLVERGRDLHFRMMKISRIDPEKQCVETIVGSLHYDYLVIATGTLSNFFGNDAIEKYGLPLRTLRDALDMRSQILQNFEKATISDDITEQDRLTNFVIVGGGPTGVELAGALSELRKNVFPRDYPELDMGMMHIYLVHSREHLLPYMDEKGGIKAEQYLREMGVNLVLETKVVSYDGRTAGLSNDTTIETEGLIWCAGTKGAFIEGLKEESSKKGSFLVNEFNQVQGYTNVFAIGDIAYHTTEDYPKGYPGVAQTAIQQGRYVAKHLERTEQQQSVKPFVYFNKGTIATIGRNRAVADLFGKVRAGGWFAWFTWWVIHIYYLVGFRNKLGTMANWILNYFSYKNSSRLIVRPYLRPDDHVGQEIIANNDEDVP